MLDLLIPMLLAAVAVAALARRQDLYAALLEGGLDGLRLLVSIVPALVMLLTAVHLLRASGAVDLLTRWLTPAARVLGLPPQVLPLVLLRPVSGSAALAVGADLMAQYGADSLIGRTAAVVLIVVVGCFCVYTAASLGRLMKNKPEEKAAKKKKKAKKE